MNVWDSNVNEIVRIMLSERSYTKKEHILLSFHLNLRVQTPLQWKKTWRDCQDAEIWNGKKEELLMALRKFNGSMGIFITLIMVTDLWLCMSKIYQVIYFWVFILHLVWQFYLSLRKGERKGKRRKDRKEWGRKGKEGGSRGLNLNWEA